MLASFPAWDGRWDEQLPGNRSILGKNIDWVRKQVGEALYDASPHDTNLLTSGRDLGLRTSAMMPDALLYAAQTLLISCLVPRSQYLSFDISRGDLCRPGALDRLEAFLQRPLNRTKMPAMPGCR